MMLRKLLGVFLVLSVLGGAQPGPAAAEPGSYPVVAFIGDSYAWGSGATAKDKRWTTLVSASKGWLEFNVAEGGTGYQKTFENRPNYYGQLDEVSALRPDIVVVSGGQNDQDMLNTNSPELFAAVSHFFVQLRSRLPRANIIAVGPSFPDAPNPDRFAFDRVVRDAVRAVGGQFVSLLRPTPVIDPAMLEPDRVHVNDSGHAAIADRVLAGLDRV